MPARTRLQRERERRAAESPDAKVMLSSRQDTSLVTGVEKQTPGTHFIYFPLVLCSVTSSHVPRLTPARSGLVT